MRFFIDQQTRIIVYGIHNEIARAIVHDSRKKGINIVGAIEAGEGGSWGSDGQIPVFDSLQSASKAVSPDAVAICVPSQYGFTAIAESIFEGIKTIVCFSGGIPLYDLSKISSLLKTRNVNFLGPDSFGIISPGKFTFGSKLFSSLRKGRVGVISRSHELTYETAHILSQNGLGVSTAIGLSMQGDLGIQLLDLLQRFDQDPETGSIFLLENALNVFDDKTNAFITNGLSKPIVAYVPEIKNPVEEKFSSTGLKDSLAFLEYQSKINEINRAGIPLINSLIEIIDFQKNL